MVYCLERPTIRTILTDSDTAVGNGVEFRTDLTALH